MSACLRKRAQDVIMNNLSNSIVAWILASPLHKLLSSSTLMLTMRGRRSDQPISVTVNYTQSGRQLSVTSRIERKWWRNLSPRADALRTPVSILLRGRRRTGTGVAFSGSQSVSIVSVIDGLKTIVGARPGWAKAFGIAMNAQSVPSSADLERAARTLVYVDIELDDSQATDV
jgi:hypothetical protein